MKERYVVKFHLENCGEIGRVLRREIEEEFVSLYNTYVAKVNPMLQTWNDEFWGNNPEASQEEYEAFIYDKAIGIAESVNGFFLTGSLNDDCVYTGIIYGMPESRVYVTLKKVS